MESIVSLPNNCHSLQKTEDHLIPGLDTIVKAVLRLFGAQLLMNPFSHDLG